MSMNDLTRGERLQIMLTREELEALDNWRFARRMPSRAAAVRELLKRGLAAEGFAEVVWRQQIRGFRRYRRVLRLLPRTTAWTPKTSGE